MEKYGEIPKRFTKEWWSYFWDYYKWHVIGGAVALAMIIITAVQLMSKVAYDEIVTYIGEASYSDSAVGDIADSLAEIIPDVNNNGKNDVGFQVLQMAKSASGAENPQYTAALETKKTFEIQFGEGFVFLLDKDRVDNLTATGLAEAFMPADEWMSKNKSGKANETVGTYFVKLKSNKFFSERGFETDDIYVGVRALRADEKDEADKKTLDAAINIAEYLIANS